ERGIESLQGRLYCGKCRSGGIDGLLHRLKSHGGPGRHALWAVGCEPLRRPAGGAAQRVKRGVLGLVGGDDARAGGKAQIREFGALLTAAGDEPLGDGTQGSAAAPGACGGTYLGGGASAVIVTTAGSPLAVVVPPLPATGVGAGGETYAHHQYEQR